MTLNGTRGFKVSSDIYVSSFWDIYAACSIVRTLCRSIDTCVLCIRILSYHFFWVFALLFVIYFAKKEETLGAQKPKKLTRAQWFSRHNRDTRLVEDYWLKPVVFTCRKLRRKLSFIMQIAAGTCAALSKYHIPTNYCAVTSAVTV